MTATEFTDRTAEPTSVFRARLAVIEAAPTAPEAWNPLREFAEWIVSLDDDDPESPGRQERRTVTLSRIVDRARVALGQPTRPLDCTCTAGDRLSTWHDSNCMLVSGGSR